MWSSLITSIVTCFNESLSTLNLNFGQTSIRAKHIDIRTKDEEINILSYLSCSYYVILWISIYTLLLLALMVLDVYLWSNFQSLSTFWRDGLLFYCGSYSYLKACNENGTYHCATCGKCTMKYSSNWFYDPSRSINLRQVVMNQIDLYKL